jgi:hypothetical protein
MLMADINIDTRVVPNGEITIDLNAPFEPEQFFIQMRDWGVDPLVRNGGLYCAASPVQDRRVLSWAAKADPEGSRRMEYVRKAWANRTSDDEVIPLGV